MFRAKSTSGTEGRRSFRLPSNDALAHHLSCPVFPHSSLNAVTASCSDKYAVNGAFDIRDV
jgi:hypothetical protein